MMVSLSGDWNEKGGNIFTQDDIDRMFMRYNPAAAEARKKKIESFDRIFEHYKKAGLINIIQRVNE